MYKLIAYSLDISNRYQLSTSMKKTFFFFIIIHLSLLVYVYLSVHYFQFQSKLYHIYFGISEVKHSQQIEK